MPLTRKIVTFQATLFAVAVLLAFGCLFTPQKAMSAEPPHILIDSSKYLGGTLWEYAKVFCEQRGGRLPTVAEVEPLMHIPNRLGLPKARVWTSDYSEGEPLVFSLAEGTAETFPYGMRFTTICAAVPPLTPPVIDARQKPFLGSWIDASARCAKNNKRLPSVRELQYVAATRLASTNRWPDMLYWSSEVAPVQGKHWTVLLQDGLDTYYPDGMNNFSICVD